jgi:hypothetical protein
VALLAGLVVLSGGLVLSLWPSHTLASAVWCKDGTVDAGTGYSTHMAAYGDPVCSGATHSMGYDHYDTTIPNTTMDYIQLAFLRVWRCGTLVYYQSDPSPLPPDAVNVGSRNIWAAWYSGYLSTCVPQSDHQSHYFKSGGLNAWGYTNV